MGPKLLVRTSKKTGIRYSLRLFPVGGFCAMEGEGENSNPVRSESSEQSVEENKDPRSYKNKPAWVKMIILFAGPVMNILLGFVMTFVMVIATRGADGQIILASNTVTQFDSLAISAETGLRVGDTVIKVGNTPIHTGQELTYEISMQGREIEEYRQYVGGDNFVNRQVVSLDLTVIRDGETIVLEDVKFFAEIAQGTVLGNTDFYVARERVNFGSIVKQTFFRSLSSVKMVWDSLVGLISGRFGLVAVSGPVGISEAIGDAAQEGALQLLNIVALISINLGVMNLMPIPALDGGRMITTLVEMVTRKKIPAKIEATINAVGLAVLLGFSVIILIKDVIMLFIG